MLRPVRNDRTLAVLAVVAGIVLIVIGIVYWALPARSLPELIALAKTKPGQLTYRNIARTESSAVLSRTFGKDRPLSLY